MTLAPIPKRKGMVPYSVGRRPDGSLAYVLYRTEEEARIAARGGDGIADAAKAKPDPKPAPATRPRAKKVKRGALAAEQCELEL